MYINARAKVVIGFILAIFLIVGVVAITFSSVNKLLSSVQSLAKPNEKLRSLNHLLADIYQLDKSRSVFVEEDTAQGINYFNLIQERIENLESLSMDSLETKQIRKIGHSVNELLVVYKGLEEVKKNLYERNFSKEALTNIERKIRRKEELSRLQSLGKLRIGINPGSVMEVSPSPKPNLNPNEDSSKKALSVVEKVEIEKLMGMLRTNLNRIEPNDDEVLTSSDSVIYAVRQIVADITNEEQYLRSRLSMLEQELNNKNKELIINIQGIVTALQEEAIALSDSENVSAYELAYRLSLLLGLLIVVGVIGSTGFIFNIVRDINNSETYQKKLAEAKKRSDNLAKTKQDFLASMSHEIRNPLHLIQGYNEAMAKTKLESDQKEFVRMISFASGTLLGIVNDILDFSKLEAGKIKIEQYAFDPQKLFNNLKLLFEPKAEEKGLAFNFSLFYPKGKWFKGDELRINQILHNLISNALKFTEKGEVTVSVHYFDLGKIAIKVEDTGKGMSESLKKTLFTEFNQGEGSISRRFGGTGLGLAIVKKLVDLQKGSITVDSEEGKGTTVTVMLPTEILEPTGKVNYRQKPGESIRGLKILLVDDDQAGLKYSSLMLKNLGAEVSAYLGGVDFKNNFKGEAFDLALLDIQMPEVDGFQVLKMLKSQEAFASLPKVAMTANVFAKERDKIEEDGFDGIILKPFNEQEFLHSIQNIISIKGVLDLPELPAQDLVSPQENPKYDLSEMEKFCMGDEELFKEVMEGFYSQTGLDLIQLNKSFDEGDFVKIQAIAHQLSSRLAQLKIEKERKLVQSIEITLKKGQTIGVQEKIWQLTEQLMPILEEIAEKFGYKLVSN